MVAALGIVETQCIASLPQLYYRRHPTRNRYYDGLVMNRVFFVMVDRVGDCRDAMRCVSTAIGINAAYNP
jgi:hypothetical protein